jgi:hypothetical protein
VVPEYRELCRSAGELCRNEGEPVPEWAVIGAGMIASGAGVSGRRAELVVNGAGVPGEWCRCGPQSCRNARNGVPEWPSTMPEGSALVPE